MGPIQNFDDVLSLLRRRGWLIAAIILIGTFLSVMHALRQPHVYEATAVLQLQAPKIAGTLAPTTVEAPSERQIQAVEQQMMARDNLLRLDTEFGVLANLPALSPMDRVSILRELIRIRPIAAVRSGDASDTTVSGISITVRAYGPVQVQQLTNAIADQIIALIRDARLEQTETTRAFFAERAAELSAAVVAQEREVTLFKNEHDLTLDGSLEFRRLEISTLQRAILDIERERLTLQSALDKLSAEPQLRVVERRMEELRTEIEGYDSQKRSLLQRSADLARAIEDVPEIQNQLGVLEGELQRLEEQRATALANLSNSETAHRLELSDQAERLRFIEPAVAPEYPVAPSRKKIAVTGAVAATIGALFLAFLLDLRRPVIRSARQMERELGLTPVVTIPHFASPYEAHRNGNVRKVGLISGGFLGVILLLIGVTFL